MAANKLEYVLVEYDDPSHAIQPDGAADIANVITAPAGTALGTLPIIEPEALILPLTVRVVLGVEVLIPT